MINKLIAFAKEHNLGVVLNISRAIYLIFESFVTLFLIEIKVGTSKIIL